MKFPFFWKKEEVPEWYARVPRDGIERKERSEAILRREKVPLNRHLPIIKVESQARIKTTEEVVKRMIALALVAVKGEGGLEDEHLKILCERYQADDCFSPVEKAFMTNPNPTDLDRVQFAWRYECLWFFLWATQFITDLPRPDAICDVPRAVGFARELKREGLFSQARLRPTWLLLDYWDLIYRYHWAVRDAQINGKVIPANLDPGVVMERHYAANWLIQANVEWDNVETHT